MHLIKFHLTQHPILSKLFNRNGLEEKDVLMLKKAFDNLDESNQGSIPLSKLTNHVIPPDGMHISETQKRKAIIRHTFISTN